jgi:hypothetical protein
MVSGYIHEINDQQSGVNDLLEQIYALDGFVMGE